MNEDTNQTQVDDSKLMIELAARVVASIDSAQRDRLLLMALGRQLDAYNFKEHLGKAIEVILKDGMKEYLARPEIKAMISERADAAFLSAIREMRLVPTFERRY